MNNKILDEYVNYVGVSRNLMSFTTNIYTSEGKIFNNYYQIIFEDRVLQRIRDRTPPYNGFLPIADTEYKIINDIFYDTFIYRLKILQPTYDTLSATDHKNLNTFIDTSIISMIQDMRTIRDHFIDQINNKATIYKEIYDTVDNKIIVRKNKGYLQYRDIRIPLDTRLTLLLEMGGKKRFLRMVLRYLGYGVNGQHCSLPTNVYKYLYDALGVKGEGFASPLNSKLMCYDGAVYCTLFRDTDRWFGSSGPFSKKILVKHQTINWVINPPYMPSVLKFAYEQVMEAFDTITRDDFLVIYLIPQWKDNETYVALHKSPYCVRVLEPAINAHYMNCNGRVTYMRSPVNSMFFLSRSKTLITDAHIKSIATIWNTYSADDDNQSKLSKAHFIKG